MLVLLAAMMLWQAQGEDIYQRVRARLGEAAVGELRAKNFSALEERLASLKLTGDDDRAEVLALKGALEFLNHQMAPAAADFQQAEKIHPVSEEDRFTLAMALVNLGDAGQARSVLAILAHEHETTALYWYWLGRLDYYQRRYSESVENLEKAVKLDPKAARAWDSLGLAWDMQGQMESARGNFERAVTLNREQTQPSPWPPHNLGYLLLRLGETEKAEQALRESLRYDVKLARTHYYLARVLEKEDRDSDAIAEYQNAVSGDKTSADACYSLAMLYRKLKRETDANAMFSEYRKRKSSDSPPTK